MKRYCCNFSAENAGSQMWRMNGDGATFRRYGVDAGNCDETCRAALKAELTPAQMAFLRNLQLKHVEGDYLFVHAGLRPGCALEEQSAEDLMWIRQPFLDLSQDWGYTVIHGHTTVAEPNIRARTASTSTRERFGRDDLRRWRFTAPAAR